MGASRYSVKPDLLVTADEYAFVHERIIDGRKATGEFRKVIAQRPTLSGLRHRHLGLFSSSFSENQMRRYNFLMAGAVAAAVACSDQNPVTPRPIDAARTSKASIPAYGPWARIVQGSTGPGSLYALYIPQNWNGDAVYFAHGIVPPQAPIALNPDQDNFLAVLDQLGAMGYAFAYSSFSENGWAVKDGAQRTHQLRGLLSAELNGPPKRNYLAGYSLGALIGVDLAEQFPQEYDGLLAMCGMIGGGQFQAQYIGDVRVLFDYFYPGVLPGNVITPPASPPSRTDVQNMVLGALFQNYPTSLMGALAIASTAQTPLASMPSGNVFDPSSPAFQTMATSLISALYYQLIGTQDVLDRTHGHSPYDNHAVTYTLGTPIFPPLATTFGAMIDGANTGVGRFTSPPDARNYLDNYYEPTGRIRFPVVTVHNLYDNLVPYAHEPRYKQIVQNAGADNLLAQRVDPPPTFGHCDQWDPSYVIGSFEALVNWVTNGVKPQF
jgi:pimeloyl-ACP methyl ester carboxylesterase